jgi:hypothetical protein
VATGILPMMSGGHGHDADAAETDGTGERRSPSGENEEKISYMDFLQKIHVTQLGWRAGCVALAFIN